MTLFPSLVHQDRVDGPLSAWRSGEHFENQNPEGSS